MKNAIRVSLVIFLCLLFNLPELSAQEPELSLIIDTASATKPLSKIFNPAVDLSGRGFSRDPSWPGALAAQEALNAWEKEIGFNGTYRIQYNLWELSEYNQDKVAQKKLLDNYEANIKKISDAGGVVILNIFGMPRGMGKVLDKRSSPKNPAVFKEYIKSIIRDLSCNKKYNIWYEVWNAPDLESFFLGRQEEYFSLYRIFAQAVQELEKESKLNIPMGGPSVSSWFANSESNSVATPERSLIYELIKFCYRYKLPLDFISWHAYSSGPGAESSGTIYNKSPAQLIRNWLKYFSFAQDTPLVIDEWNFDLNTNMAPERASRAFVAASFIPSRLEKMDEAGIDRQLYFALEDFQNNKENVERNLGVFSFDPEASAYNGKPKVIFNVFKMLKMLGPDLYAQKLNDPFAGVIATKSQDSIRVLIFNYIDPMAADNYIADNIASLNADERNILVEMSRSEKLSNIISGQDDIAALHTTKKIKAFLKEAKERGDLSKKFSGSARNLTLVIKNLNDPYTYQRYSTDSSCSSNCDFSPREEKDVGAGNLFTESLALSPYSVNLIVLNKKPKPVEAGDTQESPAAQSAPANTTEINGTRGADKS